jgi:hypothetical protein
MQSIQEARHVTKRLLLPSFYNRLLYINRNVVHVMELAQIVLKLSHVAVFGKADCLIMPAELYKAIQRTVGTHGYPECHENSYNTRVLSVAVWNKTFPAVGLCCHHK